MLRRSSRRRSRSASIAGLSPIALLPPLGPTVGPFSLFLEASYRGRWRSIAPRRPIPRVAPRCLASSHLVLSCLVSFRRGFPQTRTCRVKHLSSTAELSFVNRHEVSQIAVGLFNTPCLWFDSKLWRNPTCRMLGNVEWGEKLMII